MAYLVKANTNNTFLRVEISLYSQTHFEFYCISPHLYVAIYTDSWGTRDYGTKNVENVGSQKWWKCNAAFYTKVAPLIQDAVLMKWLLFLLLMDALRVETTSVTEHIIQIIYLYIYFFMFKRSQDWIPVTLESRGKDKWPLILHTGQK